MERRIKEYIGTNEKYKQPYLNHNGNSSLMGYCNYDGKGRGFVEYKRVNDNYSGKDILSYNNHKLYMIDGYLLYITNIHEPWANAEIVKNDLTTQHCYVGKINDNYAVSDTLYGAVEKLRENISSKQDNKKDVAKAFVNAHPNYNKEYDWMEMISWYILNNRSCVNGGIPFTKFCKKNSESKATPKELIELMKQYGIQKTANYLEKYYLEKES
jgi:hypothetical protein